MNILLVTDKYFPRALANAICVQMIAEQFVNTGHQVHILAYKDTGINGPLLNNGVHVHYINTDFRFRCFYYHNNFPTRTLAKMAYITARVYSTTLKLIHIRKFPLYSEKFPKRICQEMINLHNKFNFDLVISTYAPFENILAGLWFKNKFSNIKWGIYSLDSFFYYGLHHFNGKKAAIYWLNKFLEYSDIFLYMKSRKKEYTTFLSAYTHKMFATDIPLLVSLEREEICKKCDAGIEKWVYAGTIKKPNYDIIPAIKSFISISKNDTTKEFHIYSNGSDLVVERQIVKEAGARVFFHEYVDYDKLKQIYESASILISVKNTDNISAKIFEYMSYHKPILHFSGIQNDPNKAYIEKYCLGKVINTYSGSEHEWCQEICSFLQFIYFQAPTEISLNEFVMNTPQYTCDLIMRYCGNNEQKI